MKLAFICEMPSEHFVWWNDGLKAALDYLKEKEKWQVDIYNMVDGSKKIPDIYDFGLFWGPLIAPRHQKKYFKKQGLCFSGGPYVAGANVFDVIFVESQIDVEGLQGQTNVLKAFGYNDKLFKPMPEQPKIFDAIYPAAFAKWKNHHNFVKALSNSTKPSIAIGYIQPDGWEKECYEVCQQNNVAIFDWVPPKTLVYFYNAADRIVLTPSADGGCQRSFLEAVGCERPIEIRSDSPKLRELSQIPTQRIFQEYSHVAYAKALKNGIEEVLNGS